MSRADQRSRNLSPLWRYDPIIPLGRISALFALSLVLQGCVKEPSERYFVPSVEKADAAVQSVSATAKTPEQVAALVPNPAEMTESIGLRFDPAYLCEGVPWTTTKAINTLMAQPSVLPQVPSSVGADPLSPGDLLEVKVREGAMFDAALVVSADGMIRVPQLPPIMVAGLTVGLVEAEIERLLVEHGFFRPHAANVTLSLRQLGEISISVSGAIFEPGLINTGQRSENSRDDVYDSASGSDNWRRKLSGLLKASGGVRPDADISRVTLRRNGQVHEFDMSGIFTGGAVDDPLVVAGDAVFVPSRSCFEPSLVRTSRVTPPGVRIFMSNPTSLALSGANSVGGPFASRMPYGTRLLQALVSAHCIGGAGVINSDRYALLVGENPLSGEPEGIKVNVQDVMLNPHRADLNPYLQANDAIACYDSTLVNVSSLATVLTGALSPAQILSRVLGL